MIQVHTGYGRWVVLVGAVAIKLPNPRYGDRAVVLGMMANIREAERYAQAAKETPNPRLAKVWFRLPFGLALVMRRYAILDRPLSQTEQANLPITNADPKMGNYGVDNLGRIIVLDYGHSDCWYIA